jgi:hypothetical protein
VLTARLTRKAAGKCEQVHTRTRSPTIPFALRASFVGEATLVESQPHCGAMNLVFEQNRPRSELIDSREAEHDHAVLGIRKALDAIEIRDAKPDDWERASLVLAIDMLVRGQYAYALHFVQQTMTPAAKRLRVERPFDTCLDWVGISTLRNALEAARVQPIPQKPDFCPSPLRLQPDQQRLERPAAPAPACP